MSRLLIRNPLRVATMDDSRTEFSGGHILIENDVISSLGPEPIVVESDQIIDATGMVVVPGFINTHHHLYQTLTRNIPRMQNLGLFDWLAHHYEVWRELTVEAVHISAQTGLLELMKSGVTTSSDHLYLFPQETDEELIDAEIEAARTLGIRFQPTRGSMSLGKSQGGLPPDDVVQTEAAILADTERLVHKYHDDSAGAMLRISLAPCSPFSVTAELMRSTAAYAKDHGLQIHTHLAESLDEERYCEKAYGQRPVAYVESLDWLSENSWFAHAVHLNDEEIKRIGDLGVGISHCPSSNMRLGSGIARIKELLDAGAGVSLGVDGSASNDAGNMLLDIRNAMLISRLREEPYWLTARDVLWMATRGGARVLGRQDVGELAAGKRADLALFSMQGIEYAGGLSDPLAALVFSARLSPVDVLIVNGRIRWQKGQSLIDEEALIRKQNRLSHEMLERAISHSGIDLMAQYPASPSTSPIPSLAE